MLAKPVRETILIGGTHCDMGWAIQFVARARYKAQAYKRVVVACEEPFKYLFADFATEFETYPVPKGLRDRWLFNGKAPLPPGSIRVKYPDAKLFYPNEDRCKRKKAIWFKYGEKPDTWQAQPVLFHARNLPKVGYDKRLGINRNWPERKWDKLSFTIRNPFIVKASIGALPNARLVCDTIPLFNEPIEVLCNTMANARVIVGESSGPLHLAALCGCPVVVWTHAHKEKSLGGHTNRWRYEKGWNPFRTPVTVLDKWGWNPPVSVVTEAVRRYL